MNAEHTPQQGHGLPLLVGGSLPQSQAQSFLGDPRTEQGDPLLVEAPSPYGRPYGLQSALIWNREPYLLPLGTLFGKQGSAIVPGDPRLLGEGRSFPGSTSGGMGEAQLLPSVALSLLRKVQLQKAKFYAVQLGWQAFS